MSSIPLLPRLNDEKKIAFSKRGEWKSDSQNTLPNLVKDLKVTTDYKSTITSIPDSWARPKMYEMVLFNENHHLHEQYLEQWRGILAILALREMRNFKDVKCYSITLPETTKLNEDTPIFLKVLANMLPEEYKRQEYKDATAEDGYKIQLIAYQDTPMAVIWPTILLYPAVGLESIVDRSIPWVIRDRGVVNPIPSLSDQEKCLLIKWLDGIKESLPENGTNTDSLMKLLQDYQYALQKKVNTDIKVDNYALGSPLNITGFCKALDKPIRCSIDGDKFLAVSNVMLQSRFNDKAKKLLILTSDMYKQWNKAKSEIIVAGNINFEAAYKEGNTIFEKSKLNDIDLTEFNAELRMGEDLFTDKICLLDTPNDIFPNAIKNIKVNYGSVKNVILPIKKELLDYMKPEEIFKNFRISVGEGNIRVELDLQLTGFDAVAGSKLTISKVYNAFGDVSETKKQILDRDLRAPLIQIWPNFIPHNEEDWQAYYTFYDDKSYMAFSVKPLWNEYEERELTFDGVKAVVTKGSTFPDGFSCYYDMDTVYGIQEVELGLILLDKPKPLPYRTNNSFSVGIDFGTTNTVAYYAVNGNPQMIKLLSRLYNVTNIIDDEGKIVVEDEVELRRYFFTSSDQPNGDSLSIRTLFNPYDGAFSGNMDQPIFPGVIYYLDGMDNFDDDSNLPNIIQGRSMKWDSEEGSTHGIQYTKWFLYQLALQCMAEAVIAGATHIDWFYSYPKAFSSTQKRTMSSIWNKILEFCNKVAPNISSINAKATSKTESLTMAEFFRNNMRGTFDRGMICLDIGGGSTDIAIWQGKANEEPKGQSSLLFAGNDILTKQLFEKRETLLKLKNNNNDFNKFIQQLYDIPENDFNAFSMQLEALLKYHSKTLFESLMNSSEDSEIKQLTRNIAFALSGIFYYAGVLTGDLISKGLLNEDGPLPHCYVGGNGSKLLDWVDLGDYNSNPSFKKVYTTCLAAGVINKFEDLEEDQVENCEVRQSARPKGEVAYGLVCDDLNGANEGVEKTVKKKFKRDRLGEDSEEPILAGETIYKDGLQVENPSISKDDVISGIKISKKLPCFKEFISYFNDEISSRGYSGKLQVQFSDKDFEDICEHTNEILERQSRAEKEKMNLEPPFIIVLKQALEILAK